MTGNWAAGSSRRSGGGKRRLPDTPQGRVPPADVDAEKAVLSSIMIDAEKLSDAVATIRAEDFYQPAHQLIFEAMIELNDRGEPIDLTVLHHHLRTRDLLERVGGVAYLAELADYEAIAANVEHYSNIVRDKAMKRSLIQVSSEIAAMAFEDADPSSEVFDEAERQIFELGNVRSRSSLKALNDEMQETASFLEGLMGRSGELSGLPTGFAGLDQKTGGFQEGDLIIIAARPSMGKTALALNIARNTAVDHGKKVAFFSLEMTSRSLVLRMLASEAQVDASVFRSGLMGGDVFKKLMAAAGRLAEEKIWIDDSSVSTVRDIRAKARRLHARENLDLIIVDYLQLARGDGRSDNREQEISAISRGLKSLAGELKVPVIAVSQLNRGPESRGAEDKRPLLSDLRESGAIEQDADVIAFIYRDVVYNRETEFEDMAELIVAKQRNGPTGTVKLQFNSRFAQFTDWDRDDAYAGASGTGLGPTLAPSSFDGDF
ncbi:MAG: replicative DNA helicase [Myxococcota bacterium]